MKHSILCLVFLISPFGCASRQVATLTPVVQSTEIKPPEPTTVRPGARYLLRTCTDDPRAKNHSPQIEKYLLAGTPLGFEMTETGELQAVAGEERITLESGYRYEWCLQVFQPSSSENRGDSKETTLMYKTIDGAIKVGEVTVTGVGVVALACLRILMDRYGSNTNRLGQ
jgi:hypothetical protein